MVVFLLLFFIFGMEDALAQIVINEFSSSDSNDWIEIYNLSSSEIDLSGWVIRDTASTPVHEFLGSKIPAGGFCFEQVSNRLNNTGDRIQLFNGSAPVDCVSYGDGHGSFCGTSADVAAPSSGETASRVPEGTGTWILGSPSQSTTSCSSLVPTPTTTPTPTPSPTSTPTPTPTPTPSPTPKPTPTPKPPSTPTPKPSVTKGPTPLGGSDEGGTADASGNTDILGLRAKLMDSQSTTSSVLGTTDKKIPIMGYVLGGLGVLLVGVSVFIFLKRKAWAYNKESEEIS